MDFTNSTLTAVDVLMVISWLLLLAIGGLLIALLFKLVFLLQSISEFLTIARYELAPVIKDLRLTADNLGALSAKAVTGVETVEKGVQTVSPVVQRGVEELRHTTSVVRVGVGSIVEGIRYSFSKRKSDK